MARILVTDPIASEGLELLRQANHEIVDISKDLGRLDQEIPLAEAWIIRSGTTITGTHLEAASKLRAIGRAGVGVDNVALADATRHGVPVFHSPTGNITSAAEQAWALLLAVARRTPEADAGMKQGKWLRKELKGFELAGKRIFIVGLGRIGRMMAARAQAFEMDAAGYDPYVTPEQARSFGVTWQTVEEGFAEADIVTLHTPLTPQTQAMVNRDLLTKSKPGLVLINAARGGLIDADAVLAGLEDGTLGHVGLDVYPEEPPTDWRLPKHPRVVAAPHLGASTAEAQTRAAVQACERVQHFLATGDAGLAVNAQLSVRPELRGWADLATRMALLGAQLLRGPIQGLTLKGPQALEPSQLLHFGAIGALQATCTDTINAINAPERARELGWNLQDGFTEATDRIEVRIETDSDSICIHGTLLPGTGPRITQLYGCRVDFEPKGRLLVTKHKDVPGSLATITSILATHGVNVASLTLSRRKEGEDAIAVIHVDGSIPQAARDALRAQGAIQEAHRIRLA